MAGTLWHAGCIFAGVRGAEGAPEWGRKETTMWRVLPVTLCLLAVGCVSVSAQRLDEVVRPAQSPDSVAVLCEEPDRQYTVIAVVESSYEGALKGFDDLRREMIVESARLGGDALILGHEIKKTGVIFVPTPIFFDRKKLTGQVIVFN
jgi:hypothetical protein